MTNMGVVSQPTTQSRQSSQRREDTKLNNRPAVPGPWVYVQTGDDNYDTGASPEWLNGFTFIEDSPVAFRHGLDGQTDMIGAYDLITGSPVSGTVAFVMPMRWAGNVAPLHEFPVLLEIGATPDLDIYGMAVQVVDTVTTGNVRIYWPLVATPYP